MPSELGLSSLCSALFSSSLAFFPVQPSFQSGLLELQADIHPSSRPAETESLDFPTVSTKVPKLTLIGLAKSHTTIPKPITVRNGVLWLLRVGTCLHPGNQRTWSTPAPSQWDQRISGSTKGKGDDDSARKKQKECGTAKTIREVLQRDCTKNVQLTTLFSYLLSITHACQHLGFSGDPFVFPEGINDAINQDISEASSSSTDRKDSISRNLKNKKSAWQAPIILANPALMSQPSGIFSWIVPENDSLITLFRITSIPHCTESMRSPYQTIFLFICLFKPLLHWPIKTYTMELSRRLSSRQRNSIWVCSGSVLQLADRSLAKMCETC